MLVNNKKSVATTTSATDKYTHFNDKIPQINKKMQIGGYKKWLKLNLQEV